MNEKKFKQQAKALCEWAAGNLKESAPIFFVNGYLGHKIELKDDGSRLCIIEADNGGINHQGEGIVLRPDEVEEMYFDEDEYKFFITTFEDRIHCGQGYDIEVYQLERIEFPEVK